MATKPWTFTQLVGDRKSLTLAGSSAPHGRPRKNPVVSDAIALRTERVYYPGNDAPTTHVFGSQFPDWDLKGRFNDAWLGEGGTKQAIDEWRNFVRDGQPCLITWGDILTAQGLVHKFTPGRESEFEASYALEIHIDFNASLNLTERPGTPESATALCEALQREVTEGLGGIPKLPNAGDLKPSFLDSLDDLVSSVNEFSASLLKVAGEFDTFVAGTLNQLERLRAGVAQTRTAVLRVRATIDTSTNEATMLSRSADSDILWFSARANNDVGTLRILALLDEIDRQSELAQRGKVLAVYIARAGDSWESVAQQFYGGPQGAGKIRDANGITYGAAPTPGNSYQIPAAS